MIKPVNMKTRKTIFVVLAIMAFVGSALSQTKPKKSGTAKKAAPKAISVYICNSDKDKFFHKRSSCGGLNKCSNEIKQIKSSAELKKYRRKSCPRCHAK